MDNTNQEGAGSLRQAILEANEHVNDPLGPDLIQFNIDGSNVIALTAGLPTITEAVILDATTQPNYNGLPLVELDGSKAGADAHGLVIVASDVTVRGLVIHSFAGDGIRIQGDNNLLENNFIGTDAAGLLDRGNGGDGVALRSVNSVGGVSGNLIQNNLIAGNQGNGIAISSTRVGDAPGATGNVVRGNFIGVNLDGAALGNEGHGVSLEGASFTLVGGGSEENEGNLIAFNGLAGVSVAGGDGNGNAILTNAIYSNGGLGIDLGGDGVTPNDPNDVDVGPNDLLNFPDLLGYDPATGILTFQVSGRPSEEGTVQVQFFLNFSPDASGHGEGQIYLGEVFIGLAPGQVVQGELAIGRSILDTYVSATVTDGRLRSTSEFSGLVVIPAFVREVPGDGDGGGPGDGGPGEEVPPPKPAGEPTTPTNADDEPTANDRQVSLTLVLPLHLQLLASVDGSLLLGNTSTLILPTLAGQSFSLLPDRDTASVGGSGSELRDIFSRAYTGEIGGALFNDLNGNGQQDEGELPLHAHIVYLDANDNSKLDDDEWWTITNKGGEYRFPNLAPGRYNVRPLTETQAAQTLQAKGYEVKRIAPLTTTAPQVGRRQVELTDSQRTVYDVNFGARVRMRQASFVPVKFQTEERPGPDARAPRDSEQFSPAEEATLPKNSPGETAEPVPPR